MGPFSIPKGNPLFPLDPDHLTRGGHRGLPGVLQGVLEEGIVPGGEGGSSRTGWRERSSPETPEMADIFFLILEGSQRAYWGDRLFLLSPGRLLGDWPVPD